VARISVVFLREQVLTQIHLRRRFEHSRAFLHHLLALLRAEPEGAIENDTLDIAAAILAPHILPPSKSIQHVRWSAAGAEL